MNVGRKGEESCGGGRKRTRDSSERWARAAARARARTCVARSWVGRRARASSARFCTARPCGGRVGFFLLARRVRLRGNAVWTGGWDGDGSPGRTRQSSSVSAGARGVAVARGREWIVSCSRSAAGWLVLSRQLLMPTAEGFRGSHARNGSQFLRGCRTRRKILCKSRGPAGVWTEFFRDLPTGGLEGYLAEPDTPCTLGPF